MNRNSSRMNRTLRLVSLLTGFAVLGFSIYWSQDGFNFEIAGDGGYKTLALIAGYVLGIGVTVIQFVFSTNFRELNPSLLFLGILAYGYSIYTNKFGIIHFQGSQPNEFGAWFLGFCVDAAPEPLIAWALGESLSGDFVGNMWNTVKKTFNTLLEGEDTPKHQPKVYNSTPASPLQDTQPRIHIPQGQHKGQGSKRREFLEDKKKEDSNLFDRFGE